MEGGRLVAVVGPCGSGKSTLVHMLRQQEIPAREVGQEHTDMPYYWQRPAPSRLVYLDAGLPSIRSRKSSPDWPGARLEDQIRRLAHARQKAHIYINTDDMTPTQVYQRAVTVVPAVPSPTRFTVPGDFETIQEAVDAAGTGHVVIIVKEGTYRENLWLQSPDLTIRGTVPGDPAATRRTVIDGGGNNTTVTVHGGEAIISGLTITGGLGRLERGGARGGGITITGGGRTVISHSVITGNTAHSDGGGILLRDALAVLEDNIISGNIAGGEGGGLAVIRDTGYMAEATAVDIPEPVGQSEISQVGGGEMTGDLRGEGEKPRISSPEVPPVPIITRNKFQDNRAGGAGGSIYVAGVSPRIEYNVVESSTAERGGGIFIDDNSRPALTGNTIRHNTASSDGGGVSVGLGSSPALQDNHITGNRAELGGGLFVWERAAPRLIGNHLEHNQAQQGPELLISPLAFADRGRTGVKNS